MDNTSNIINNNKQDFSGVVNISTRHLEPKQSQTSKFIKHSNATKSSESSSNYTGISNMSIMTLETNNQQNNHLLHSSTSSSWSLLQNETQNETQNEPRNKTRNETQNETRNKTRNETQNETHNETRNETHNETHNETYNDVQINKKIIIDVAVLCQEYANIDITCNDNIINLDEIEITTEIFQSIFYPYGENFGINKDFVCNNTEMLPYISIYLDYRTIMKKKFFLLEELIANIERDLNIPRTCFTKESLIELTHEISSIKTLCDINSCSVLSSLSWSNISEIINSYRLVKTCTCNYKCDCVKSNIIPVCVVNIMFKTPTPGVKNTIIRLHYRIINM
jgi:hypothetical protein